MGQIIEGLTVNKMLVLIIIITALRERVQERLY